MEIFSSSLKGLSASVNPDTWGPVRSSGDLFVTGDLSMPYAHFDKRDKIWRSAAFVQQQQPTTQMNNKKQRDGLNPNADFAYKYDAQDDSTFQLVDTTKSQVKKHAQTGITLLFDYNFILYNTYIFFISYIL